MDVSVEDLYFMKDRSWYTTPEDEGIDDFFFPDGRGYHIKDDAPEEAKKNYEEFYAFQESGFLIQPKFRFVSLAVLWAAFLFEKE